MSLKPERVDFEETWKRLKGTVEGVIKMDRVDKREWGDRFSDVYKLCVAFPEPLGDKLYFETKAYLDHHVKELYNHLKKSTNHSVSLLNLYHSTWLTYKEGVNYLNKLYTYLNTQHIKKQKFSEADLTYGSVDPSEQKLEIGELGLHLWKINMIEPLKDNLLRLLLEAIENDRLGNPTNESVVHGVILSLVNVEEYKKKGSLDLYQDIFETPFLKATGEYYRKEADALLEGADCSIYMEKVLLRLDAENFRSRKYLHPSSYPKVTIECELRMIADHLPFLHGECKTMVIADKRKDLRNMYKLLKPIDTGLSVLVKEVQEHITKIGLNTINSLSGDTMAQLFVENVLDVHKKHLNLIKDVFNGDQQFIGALDKACASVINYRVNPKLPCKSPELLARYCDSMLKRSAKGITESEIDDKLSQSITVFKYIDDKDIFQKFYAKMLAKRLIHTQSVSMDSEEAMINRLKQACGYEFTSKLHRMFTDIKVSDDLNVNFSAWLKNTDKELGGINFSILVLQSGAWPLAQSSISPFAIPQPLEKSVQNFEHFYNSKFNGRKLTWLHHLSSVEVKICGLNAKKNFSVSMGTFHLAILLLYDNLNTLSYKEIQENTKLTDEQLTKHLQSLIDAKLLLVQQSSDQSKVQQDGQKVADEPPKDETTTTTVHVDACYALNLNYANKRTKFKITAVVQKETQQQQEVEQTHASVDEDRKLYLQASIVRIMKARKVIKHNALIQEVINQSKNRFTPSVAMIKKCIEALMEKQYLERTSESADEYNYVA